VHLNFAAKVPAIIRYDHGSLFVLTYHVATLVHIDEPAFCKHLAHPCRAIEDCVLLVVALIICSPLLILFSVHLPSSSSSTNHPYPTHHLRKG
jgi:hypothetical protein